MLRKNRVTINPLLCVYGALGWLRFGMIVSLAFCLGLSHGKSLETSDPLHLIQQAQKRYLHTKELVVSGTLRYYAGPPLRFRGKQDWVLAVHDPVTMYYRISDGETTIGRALVNDVLYFTDESDNYGIEASGATSHDIFAYLQKPEFPGAAGANHGPLAFFLKADLFTTQNPCLDRIEMLPPEVVDGTTCTVVSMGPCMYNDTVDFYLDAGSLELRRVTFTSYFSEYEDELISVPTGAASEIYSVSVYDIEGIATGRDIVSPLLPSRSELSVGTVFSAAEAIKNGRPTRGADKVQEDEGLEENNDIEFADAKLLLVTDSPTETTVPLQTVASLDAAINSVAVRNHNGERLIFAALKSGDVKILDPSGLQFDSLNQNFHEIQFPVNAPSAIMFATQEDEDSGTYNLISIDTSDNSAEAVQIAANVHWFESYIDVVTSEPMVAFIDSYEQAIYLAHGRTGELLHKRTHAGIALGLLHDEAGVSGVMYAAPGWPLITELDLELNFVRNRNVPLAMEAIAVDFRYIKGQYAVILTDGKVGMLNDDGTFDSVRSPSWGYLDSSWHPFSVKVGKGTNLSGPYLEVLSEAGLTLFNHRKEVLLQGKIVAEGPKEPGALFFDSVYHADFNNDGMYEVLCVYGRNLYLLNYGSLFAN